MCIRDSNTHDTQHTGSGLVLVTRRASSTHTTLNTLLVDLSLWQDVPAQHTLHSAHRRLVRHCCRQCLGLVAPTFAVVVWIIHSRHNITHNKHCTVLLSRYYVYRVNTCTYHHSNDQIRTFIYLFITENRTLSCVLRSQSMATRTMHFNGALILSVQCNVWH